jgi:hypothetical protein
MLKAKQVSFLDHPELVGTARYGVPVSPEELASRFHTVPERSFDDLGFYEFFGIDADAGLFGFRMHTRPEDRVSYVSFVPNDKEVDAVEAISHLCRVPREKILSFEESW